MIDCHIFLSTFLGAIGGAAVGASVSYLFLNLHEKRKVKRERKSFLNQFNLMLDAYSGITAEAKVQYDANERYIHQIVFPIPDDYLKHECFRIISDVEILKPMLDVFTGMSDFLNTVDELNQYAKQQKDSEYKMTRVHLYELFDRLPVSISNAKKVIERKA